MKLCPKCDRLIAEEIPTCPVCGSDIGAGRTHIDDYRILEILHEGHASLLCKALRERTDETVMIRLFTAQSGVNAEVAQRLERELEQLKQLPSEGFVRHHAIRRSADGLWYRISEWVDAANWGSLLASGRLDDLRVALSLFRQTASILSTLHRRDHIIPHLILNDIMVVEDEHGALDVKIDYKLSRFLDPKMDQPGPMLGRLLAAHPDIVNQRPLDFQSDIWSLGKVFVEILAADLDVANYREKVEELALPGELEVLLKVMLADDPDLRPKSMAEIAAALTRILESEEVQWVRPPIERPAATAGLIRRLQKRVRWLAAVVVGLAVAAAVAWVVLERRQDPSAVLERFANRYAAAVAFVVSEYRLEIDGQTVYGNRTEGTAFLVDAAGYLLTSRHVICPWLEDSRLLAAAQHFQRQQRTPEFHYRAFLWFEGQPAFNPTARAFEASELDDVYLLESAYGTRAAKKLVISGVAKPPVKIRQLLASPLRDDFAVLKVDPPPALKPLPLDPDVSYLDMPKLSRIIALGFPLGSRVQAEEVNVSVVRGNVRRSLKGMVQIDASLHGGNSGGPVIDQRGRVIGIVAAVAVDWSQGLVPMATPVWDMGMVLPIAPAAELLAEIKRGGAKWNGVLDFSIDRTLAAARARAAEGKWAEAAAAVDARLEENLHPSLITAAGMLNFCAGSTAAARRRFEQALSIDADDQQAALMLFLIDWLAGRTSAGMPYRQRLLAADWRSPAEFQGYLARLLDNPAELEASVAGGYNASERSWLRIAAGLVESRRKDWEAAEKMFREAVLAAEPNSWEFFLARARLADVRRQRRASLTGADRLQRYNQDADQFELTVQQKTADHTQRQERQAVASARLSVSGLPLNERRRLLEELAALDPSNRYLPAAAAYAAAADGAWEAALQHIRVFLETTGRENAVRLGLGLLEVGILRCQGAHEEAKAQLAQYRRQTRNPWYLTIAEYLDGQISETAVSAQVENSPEQLTSAYTVMGFWAEGAQDTPTALRFYKQALGAFMDDWLEYDFLRERIRRLRQPAG